MVLRGRYTGPGTLDRYTDFWSNEGSGEERPAKSAKRVTGKQDQTYRTKSCPRCKRKRQLTPQEVRAGMVCDHCLGEEG